jgi:hypothetical protein
MYTNEGESRYILNSVSCKHPPKTVTVREWIADIASEEAEKAGRLWGDIVMALYPLVKPDAMDLSESEREKVFASIFGALWLSYDMSKPFLPQLEENFISLKAMLEELSQAAKKRQDSDAAPNMT